MSYEFSFSQTEEQGQGMVKLAASPQLTQWQCIMVCTVSARGRLAINHVCDLLTLLQVALAMLDHQV